VTTQSKQVLLSVIKRTKISDECMTGDDIKQAGVISCWNSTSVRRQFHHALPCSEPAVLVPPVCDAWLKGGSAWRCGPWAGRWWTRWGSSYARHAYLSVRRRDVAEPPVWEQAERRLIWGDGGREEPGIARTMGCNISLLVGSKFGSDQKCRYIGERPETFFEASL